MEDNKHTCAYCGSKVEYARDSSGYLYCPLCGFYVDEGETVEDANHEE